MADVTQQIKQLTFESVGPVETAYLNHERVNDRFVSSIGPISSWVANISKTKGGKVGLWLFGLATERASGDQLSIDVTNPMARALILLASAEDSGLVKPLDEAQPLDCVLVSGRGCYRNGDLPWVEEGHPAACEPTDALEQRRKRSEAMYQTFDPEARAWLLMLQLKNGGLAAGTAHQRWIHDGVLVRYSHRPWTAFGLLEDRMDDVPLIAPIFVYAGEAD